MSSSELLARPLLMATDCASMRGLGTSVEASFLALPSTSEPGTFESWRAGTGQGAATTREHDTVIVSVWKDEARALPLIETDAKTWAEEFEQPFLLWNIALGAATRRCRPGGAIVVLVQTPAALDAAGFCPAMSIADGVVALTRSLAAAEGIRGIRANAITTPLRLIDCATSLPSPPLDSFPGRLDVEIAGAIRLLSSQDAAGLTGRVLAADGGRSLA